jgi:hypothetical protein
MLAILGFSDATEAGQRSITDDGPVCGNASCNRLLDADGVALFKESRKEK